MLKIKLLVLNPFQVNTFILYDSTKECVIIDPACYDDAEKIALEEFIEEEKLQPKFALNTHGHIDHILGNNFVTEKYNIPLKVHKDTLFFIERSKEYGQTFGFEIQDQVKPSTLIEDGDILTFGQQQLKAILVPGHANGSLCFYHEKEKKLFCGDVLFKGGIGRTDLPTGNYDKLIKNINEKLLTLPEDVVVYPGHGPETTINEEKNSNPFLTRMI